MIYFSATKNVCHDLHCTDLTTGTNYIIENKMKTTRQEHFLQEYSVSDNTTFGNPEALNQTINHQWNIWEDATFLLIIFVFAFGLLFFCFCFLYVRHTRICRTIRYCRTSDPENVVKWWCFGNFD